MKKVSRNEAFETLKKLSVGFGLLDTFEALTDELYYNYDDCMSEENAEFINALPEKLQAIYNDFENVKNEMLKNLRNGNKTQ